MRIGDCEDSKLVIRIVEEAAAKGLIEKDEINYKFRLKSPQIGIPQNSKWQGITTAPKMKNFIIPGKPKSLQQNHSLKDNRFPSFFSMVPTFGQTQITAGAPVSEPMYPIPSYEQLTGQPHTNVTENNQVQDLPTFIYGRSHRKNVSKFSRSAFLANSFEQAEYNFKDSAYLGSINPENEADMFTVGDGDSGDENESEVEDVRAFINTGEPFCFATIGVQGGGKSHTLNCILEACLIPVPEGNITNLHNPMTAVVLHYDQTITSVCEATGLIRPNQALTPIITGSKVTTAAASLISSQDEETCGLEEEMSKLDEDMQRTHLHDDNQSVTSNKVVEEEFKTSPQSKHTPGLYCLPKENMVVLVSPTYYEQRKRFYAGYCTVKPLLFDWRKLTADHIRRLMKLKDSDNQLYISSMLELLRGYQRQNRLPDFDTFSQEVKGFCKLPGQEAALTLRLNLLDAIIKQSSKNISIATLSGDLSSECASGKLIVIDLTDPLLSSDDVNGIFQVLTEQFRSLKDVKGKLLVLDEAHRYMDGQKEDGLSKAIVDVARLMRHDGMRLAISTQSPKVLAPELLELITSVVMHRFHSKDWFDYLSLKLGLPQDLMEGLYQLEPGEAYMFVTRNLIDPKKKVFRINVRPRLTADRGASLRNANI
jgi:hypothetical protein